MVLLRSGKTFDVTIILPRLAEAVIICNKMSEREDQIIVERSETVVVLYHHYHDNIVKFPQISSKLLIVVYLYSIELLIAVSTVVSLKFRVIF
jgi:hypothetical protein